LFVFRAFVRVGVGLHHQSAASVLVTDLPLLGFRLPMGCTPAGGRDFRPETVALHEPLVRRRITCSLRSTACHSLEQDLSRERTFPSRGSSPSTASSVRGELDAGLFGLRLFAFTHHTPHGAA
jgi:hypothetical protein